MSNKDKGSVKNALNSNTTITASKDAVNKTPEGRPVRIPLVQQFKLDIPEEFRKKGYAYRFIRDEANKIEAYVAAWWEPVRDGMSRPIKKASGTGGYLLLYRIKQEYFDEDAETKRKLPINLLKEQAKLAAGNKHSSEYVPQDREGVVVINN